MQIMQINPDKYDTGELMNFDHLTIMDTSGYVRVSTYPETPDGLAANIRYAAHRCRANNLPCKELTVECRHFSDFDW